MKMSNFFHNFLLGAEIYIKTDCSVETMSLGFYPNIFDSQWDFQCIQIYDFSTYENTSSC